MKVWEKNADFMDELKADPEVKKALGDDGIEACFDIAYHIKHIDTIFTRVFGDTDQ